MPLASPLGSVNKHNLPQARSSLFRTQKTALTPILQSHFTIFLFLGFGAFSTQGQQPQQSGFGTSQPQNTFGGEAHTLRVSCREDTVITRFDYQDLVELARLQNPQAPLGRLARQRRRINLVQQQASEVLELRPSLLELLDLVKLPWLVPLTLGLAGSVGPRAVAGEMQVLHKHLGLAVWNLSTRLMSRF